MSKDFTKMQIEVFESLLESAENFIEKATDDEDEVVRIAATFEATVSLLGFITANHVREDHHKETIDDVKEGLEVILARYNAFRKGEKEGVVWH